MAVKKRLKKLLVPLLIGLTLVTGFMGASQVNSNKDLTNHGVTLMTASPPVKVIESHADIYSDSLKKSIVGSALNDAGNAVKNAWSKAKHFVAHDDELLPSHSYSLYSLWDRTLDDEDKAKTYGDYVGALSASGSIKSYNNSDTLSQIIALLGQLVAGFFALIILVLLSLAGLVQMLGQAVIKMVGYLNIFQYISDAFNGAVNRGDPWVQGFYPLIDMWMQFKPLIMLVATLILIFVITKVVMSSRGSRGRTLGTGLGRYFAVFFAWGALPFVLGGMISYATEITTANNLSNTTQSVVESTYYNAKAPFASAFYKMSDVGGYASITDKGGLDESTIHASWQHNTDLGLNKMSEFDIIVSWMKGEKFDADDVNGYLGWNSTDKQGADSNRGYFSRKAKKGGGTEGDGGDSWVQSHPYLDELFRNDGGYIDGKPVIAEGVLSDAGFGDEKDSKNADLFLQTNSTAEKTQRQGSDRLRRLVTTHAIAAWGITPGGNVNVSRDTGMNTTTNRSWTATNLVGDTFIAKVANYTSMTAQLLFTIVYAVIAYVGIVTILANTIGRALIDQIRAGVGSIGAIARAFAGVILGTLMIWYVSLSVEMVAPLMSAMDNLMRTIITQAFGGNGLSSMAAQITSILAINLGGYLIVRILMKLRGALLNGGTNAVNQLAESVDRALGIQPGSDSSASAGMKEGAERGRRNAMAGFKAMDKTKKWTMNAPQAAAGAGLKMAGELAESSSGAVGAAATVYAGPAAGKAAEMGMKGLGKAAKGIGSATETVAEGDETMDKAGMGATLSAMKNNLASDEGSLGDKAKSALSTLRGEQDDSGDQYANADPDSPDADKKNSFNKMRDADKSDAEMKAARKALRQDKAAQRSIGDSASELSASQSDLNEASEKLGAAEFAQDNSNKNLTNDDALKKANDHADKASSKHANAKAAREAQDVVVDQAEEKLAQMKQGAHDLKQQVASDVANGDMSRADAKTALQNAKNGLKEQKATVAKEKQTQSELIQKQQEAEQQVHEATGAQKMVQAQIDTNGAQAKFNGDNHRMTSSNSGEQTVTVAQTQSNLVKAKQDQQAVRQQVQSDLTSGKMNQTDAQVKLNNANQKVLTNSAMVAQAKQHEQTVTVSQAEQKLVKMKQGATALQQELASNIANGTVSKANARGQLQNAQRDIKSQSAIVAKEKQTQEVLVNKQRQVEQKMRDAGVSETVIQAQNQSRPSGAVSFAGAKNSESLEVLRQQVQDKKRTVANLERTIVNDVSQHATKTDRTNVMSDSHSTSDVIRNSKSYLTQLDKSIDTQETNVKSASEVNTRVDKRHADDRIERNYGNNLDDNGNIIKK